MRFTLERQRKQYRTVYELLNETPRIQVRDITAVLGGSRNTVSKRVQEVKKNIFFSVGNYVLARLPFLDNKEQNDLLALIFTLEDEGFFTDSWQAMVISTSKRDATLTEACSKKSNDI